MKYLNINFGALKVIKLRSHLVAFSNIHRYKRLLTRFFNVCAFLVHGGTQRGSADIQHANLIHAGVKHPERVLLLLIIVTEDFTVNEGGKHLRLQETGKEGQVGLWLVGQEGSLHIEKSMSSGKINTSNKLGY